MRIEAELFQRTGDWETAKAEILRDNLFQCGSRETLARFEREIRGRLKMLEPEQLELLVNGSEVFPAPNHCSKTNTQ